MSQPDGLKIRMMNGTVFCRPEERIREYCDVDVYRDVRYIGGYDDRHSVTDVVTYEDIEAANNLCAHISGLERDRIIHNQGLQSHLSAIPDWDLGEVQDGSELEGVEAAVSSLLAELLSMSGISLAKATKLVHLKRPHLLPILDPPVVMFLTGNDTESVPLNRDETLRLALVSFEAARMDVVTNAAGFAELRRRLSDLLTPLTVVRMHDILCWTEQKWVRSGDLSAKYGTPSTTIDQSPPCVGKATAEVGESVTAEQKGTPTIPGEILSTREFRQIVGRAEGVVVITGAHPPRVHTTLCALLSDDRFKENVLINGGKGGRYYWRSSFAEARREFGATPCKRCNPGRLMPGYTGGPRRNPRA